MRSIFRITPTLIPQKTTKHYEPTLLEFDANKKRVTHNIFVVKESTFRFIKYIFDLQFPLIVYHINIFLLI